MDFKRPIAILDTETTGGNPLFSRIIEIGIIRIDPGAGMRRYSTLINPERRVSQSILDLTGIDPAELAEAPPFRDVAQTIFEWLDGCVFVAHNARFDYGFLRHEFARAGFKFAAPKVCSVKLSRTIYPQHRKHNLDSVAERFGIVIPNRHRAMDDAEAVLQFFQQSCRHDSAHFMACFDNLLSRPLEASKIPASKLNAVPETPGVYVFYGPAGEALYVGKAADLKQRIEDHFAPGSRKGRNWKLIQLAHDLEIFRTAGEFSAAVLHTQIVAAKQPLFNRKPGKVFEQLAPPAWPCATPVIVEETDPLEHRQDSFLIADWKIEAKISRIDQDEEIELGSGRFNFDVYLLIQRALDGKFRSVKVRPARRGEIDGIPAGYSEPAIQIDD